MDYNAGQPPDRQIPASALEAIYEDLPGAVNVSIDDVGVKKQKAHRSGSDLEGKARSTTDAELEPEGPRSTSTLGPEDPELKRLHHTIAHVETPQGHYILHGHGTVTVLQFLIAFLLHKDLLRDHCVQFFCRWHAEFAR